MLQVGWVSAVPDRRVASFRYRVEAPVQGLQARGHSVEVFDSEHADQYDTVVFSKAYGAEHRALARAVKGRGGRVVFDLCDNHFYNPYDLPRYRRAREELAEMMSLADRVVCSTSALAKVLREETDGGCEPIVVGDVVERHRPRSKAPRSADQPLRLTWFGSHGSPNAPSGMTDLLLIREHLEALAQQCPVELTVCSNSREKFDQTIAPMRLPTRYVDWSIEGFPKLLAQTDAAVLPMDINPFTACKTHNRLTTALYAGVPVIAAEIESYREFGAYCTLNDWENGFAALLDGPEHERERERALASRRHLEERWSLEALAPQWEAALCLPHVAASDRLKPEQLHGRLDATAQTMVTGWVRSPMQPDMPLQVVLECDGQPVAIARAELPRDDLRAVGLPAECGFSLPLPAAALSGDVKVAVRVLDSNWLVGEDPILLAGGQAHHATFAAPAAPSTGVQQAEQRWDVAASLANQERELERLKRERKAKAGLEIATGDAVVAAPRKLKPAMPIARTVLRSAADAALGT